MGRKSCQVRGTTRSTGQWAHTSRRRAPREMNLYSAGILGRSGALSMMPEKRCPAVSSTVSSLSGAMPAARAGLLRQRGAGRQARSAPGSA